jgi:uncharacterized membrane protein
MKMRKLLLFIGLLVYGTIVFAQATATLSLGSTDLTGKVPGDKIYVPVNVDAISGDLVTGYQFFIEYDHAVMSWDGTLTNPVPGVNYFHPNFPYSFSDYIIWDNGTYLIATWTDPTYNGKIINSGEKFIEFKFTYIGGQTELLWQNIAYDNGNPSPKFLTEVYDVNFTNFELTLVDGCACFPNFDVTFHVTDNLTSTDLEGALVTVGAQSLLTNAQGLAVFSLANGNYSYAVSKVGYSNKTGNFTVNGANVTIPVAMNLVGSEFDITFQVTSGGNNLAGATVTAGPESGVTNVLGEVILTLPDGTYNYTVSKYGYVTQTGPFTVAGAALTIPLDLPMLPHYDIIFHVTTGGNDLDGALVDITDIESMLTDLNGEALFSLIDGDYDYTVSKTGYTTETGTFTVAGSTMVIEISLAQLFDVTFHVTDGTADLQNAAITVGTETKYTNAAGIAVFSLTDGAYSYLVTKLDYQNATGSFTVAGANQTIEVPMLVITFTATFHVTSDGVNIEGALVTIDALSALTNASGIAVFDLQNGGYFYNVSKEGFYDSPGNFSISGSPVTIDVSLTPAFFEITFHVTSGGVDLADAIVTVGSQSFPTNTLGNVTFDLINGTYNYSVTKAGYDPETGTFTVNNVNQVIEVSMNVTVWNITFHVTSAGANLEGALVAVGTQQVTTNASGNALFILPDGTYTYSITKTGYVTQTGTFTVAGANQTIEINMPVVTWPTTFHCVSGGVGLVGVSVLCNGETIITDANGNAVFNLEDGTYDYTASKTGYNTVTGTVIVNGAAQTKTVIMTLIQWPVTFTVFVSGELYAGASVTLAGVTQVTPASGQVVFNKVNGTYPWTVAVPDYEDQTGNVTVNNAPVNITVTFVGINDITSGSFNVYPNPSNGTFNISTTAAFGYQSDITVFDLTGKLVYTGKLQGNDVNVIDLSAQEKGMYILQIIIEDKVYNKTLVIQ